MNARNLLEEYDLKLMNADVDEMRDLRKEIKLLIYDLTLRVKHMDREVGDDFVLVTRKKFIRPTIAPGPAVVVPGTTVSVRGKPYDPSTPLEPDMLYLDDANKFHLSLCGTTIVGELSAPKRAAETKRNTTKTSTPRVQGCRYFGCADHMSEGVRSMSPDEFYNMRQSLLNLYIHYSAVIYNRHDLK